ncbi:MAG: HEAT repeat domain-containing protein [Verrucomicrobiales bacterium]|nr:HEAT repeat domain-containing protein [Verrucomicrobiales bacterium]
MKIVSLLSALGKAAQMAAPALGRALRDEDESVKMIAITFFTDSEGEDALLNQLPAQLKRELLPEFLREVKAGGDYGLRNNAALALRFYPEEREVVVPVLTTALSDRVPIVQIAAAEALHRVAPDVVASEGVVPVVIGVLRNPDDQIAYRAAILLGKMGEKPALTVPALIESVQGTNRLVASSAASALGCFPQHAELIVPVLLRAYQDTNGIVSRRASGAALKKVAPQVANSLGIE